jgi:hypothetical protein
MTPPLARAALGLATLLCACGAALAGEGHDHGDAPAATGGPALPRFAAVSETFELVGVLNGRQITLYLDRSADNSPVRDAQIELEISGAKFKAEAHGDAEYEVVLAEAPKPGVLPITATVSVGQDADLLAGELDLHEAAHADEAAHRDLWKEYTGWGIGAALALAGLSFAGRRVLASRQARVGGVA